MPFRETLKATLPPEARILVIDIETVPMRLVGFGLFNQNFSIDHIEDPGRVVCFAAKWLGEKKVHFHSEHHESRREMVEAAWDLLNEAHIVVGYNHVRFDIPHLQRCFIEHGMPAPTPHKNVDLLTTVRSQFRFDSGKLAWVAEQLGIGSKVKHDGIRLWRGCMSGDEAAWKLMRRYNIADTTLTEDVYLTLRPFIKRHPNVNLFRRERVSGCHVCGSDDVVRDGWAYADTRAYPQFRCNECRALSKATHSESSMTQHRKGAT